MPGLPDPRAEVVEAVEHEWALTLEDVLRRRTQVALRDRERREPAWPDDVAALMGARLGWAPDATREAASEYIRAAEAGRRRWR